MLPRRLMVSAVVVACSGALAGGCSSSHDATVAHASSSVPVTAAPPVRVDDAQRIGVDLPPLPPGLLTAVRPPEVVRAVYQFAARHPEVLRYVPCFCGCQNLGHRGNDDCFVSRRDASGTVTAWEPHGMVCEVCLDVGAEAMRMHNSGASVSAIRAFIDKKYALPGRTQTPTPLPPRGGGIPHH
jgi:hypothetical protein